MDRDSGTTSTQTVGVLCYVWIFVAIFSAIASWTLATPLMAAPDEPSNTVQAAAAVRGEIYEPTHEGHLGLVSSVQVPEYIAATRTIPQCYAFKRRVSAGCAPAIGSETRIVSANTQFSNFPPLYYFITGLPSLLWHGETALYAMRFAGALLNGILISLGFYLLARYRQGGVALVGALVALSPMVLFLSSVINPSGLEVAAAFATWCGGICLVQNREAPPLLLIATALALTILILTRPLSPLYAAIVLVVLVLLAGAKRTREFLGERQVRLVGLVIVITVVVAGLSLVVGGYPSPLGLPLKPPVTLAGAINLSLGQTVFRLFQCIGDFGWLDTPSPWVTVVVWLAVLGLVLFSGLTTSQHCRRSLLVLTAAILALPLVFEVPRINAIGPYWQGRYWLPLVIGLPLVASAAVSRLPEQFVGSRYRAALLGAGVLLIGGQMAAFTTALRRYEVGLNVPHGSPVLWRPPGGNGLVIGLFAVADVLILAFVARYGGALRTRSTPRTRVQHLP
jgi:hypothetical protein